MTSRTVAGTSTLLRFMLRRERRALPWWLAGAAALFAVQSVGSQQTYDTAEKLAGLRDTLGGNPALVAMAGPTELLGTIGGEAVFEAFLYVSIVVALMNMFLIGRNTRAEEESGRAELIRSARVGRRAPLVAALMLATLSNVVLAALVFAAGAGTGLPVGGSVVLGLSAAGLGLFFAALTAVAVQVFDHPRAAYGSVAAELGAAITLRAAGDIGDGTLSWLSPIGWAQRTFPYVQDRWWPLALPLASGVLLAGLAVVLLDRRDFGAGLVASRPGRPTASWALRSPLGLAWRLQRGSFFGWAVGLFLLGIGLGSFTQSIEQFVADNPQIAEMFTGGVASVVDGYLAFTMLLMAITTAAYGVSAALRARGEETAGRAEAVLATKASRSAWLASHVIIAVLGSVAVLLLTGLGVGLAHATSVSDMSQIPRLLGAALVYAPATVVIVALAVLGFGLLPKAAAAAAWSLVVLCTLVALFADIVDLPPWLRDVSPFAHTPQAPMAPVAATPLLVLTGIVAALLAGGFIGLRRRDIAAT